MDMLLVLKFLPISLNFFEHMVHQLAMSVTGMMKQLLVGKIVNDHKGAGALVMLQGWCPAADSSSTIH